MTPENSLPKRIYLPPSGRFDRIVKRIEEVFFTIIVITMILIGLAPIIMRFSGAMNFSWTESLSQHMVLWIALLGAGTAIRERTSISIDIVPQLLSPRKRVFLRGITELISALTCGTLVWISIEYVFSTLRFEGEATTFLKIPEWCLTTAMPCGFFILSLRLVIASIEDLIMASRMKHDKTDNFEACTGEEAIRTDSERE